MYAAHEDIPFTLSPRPVWVVGEGEGSPLSVRLLQGGGICKLSRHSPLGEVSFVLLKQPLHQPGFRGVSDTERDITSGLTSPPSLLACD